MLGKPGDPQPVNMHDFPDKQRGKAIPYGVYDMGQNVGWVNVGRDHDTASFAVESIRRWWGHLGKPLYPCARTLLICADSGGSNGYRVRLWKRELQRLANTIGLDITVCHFPPGTSKWNKIEHRLFSYISMNWRGQPLISHEVIVELIGATTTQSGLHVEAQNDTNVYPTQIKISAEEMATLHITPTIFMANGTIRSSMDDVISRPCLGQLYRLFFNTPLLGDEAAIDDQFRYR